MRINDPWAFTSHVGHNGCVCIGAKIPDWSIPKLYDDPHIIWWSPYYMVNKILGYIVKMANMALSSWFIYKSRSWNMCKHRYKHFSITGSKNRETGSYKTGNRRRCDVLHDIYQSEVIPDRKVYVYKVLKAFLKNRKYFRSKPEVGTCFLK